MAQHSQTTDIPDSSPSPEQTPSVPLITSRFLFVDVAAQRAKQLRRGALARLDRPAPGPHKLERIAMEEVRRGLIAYTLPTLEEGARARGARE